MTEREIIMTSIKTPKWVTRHLVLYGPPYEAWKLMDEEWKEQSRKLKKKPTEKNMDLRGRRKRHQSHDCRGPTPHPEGPDLMSHQGSSFAPRKSKRARP
jgi:hypothetical protein